MNNLLVDRVTYILDQCKGKRVLHLGCTDWPFTERKASIGALLHGRINEIAASLVGVDADPDGIEWFQRHGFPATYYDNAEKISHPEVCSGKYDVILAGEIIEHLENPGLFLRSIQKLMMPNTDLIITTINAYCFFRFLYYLRGIEAVHADHNYYFSPIVLRKLITRCGLEVKEYFHYPVGKEIRSVTSKKILFLDDISRWFFPKASDGVIFRVGIPGAYPPV
jgi:2-polyprenyl-3-methyl-5-hydroxy-6-metoxy-1,4-benzoquinol methylase